MSGIPAWAFRGAPVVCINAGNIDGDAQTYGGWRRSEAPTEGAKYTIVAAWYDNDGAPVVSLAELPRPPLQGLRLGFHVARFRPLVSDSDENGIEVQFYRKAGRKSKAPVRESERA